MAEPRQKAEMRETGGQVPGDPYVRGGVVPQAWRWLFGEGKGRERPAGTTDPQVWVHQGLAVVGPAIVAAGLLAVVGYSLGLEKGARLTAFGVGCAVIAGAAAAGVMLGFLFGIPLSPAVKDGDERDGRYRANTSLEQISDWLTKILVGVGLVELQSILPKLGELVDTAASGMGGSGAKPVVAGLLVVSFAVGFVMAYLVTRTTLPRLLSDSDVEAAARQAEVRVRQTMTDQGVKDASAQGLVSRVLQGDAGVPQEELDEALAGAGPAFRVLAFNQASGQRRAHWQDTGSAKMAATVPVFQALIAADTAGKYHRNHGELGYALTTLELWHEALTALNTAIGRRSKSEARRYYMYEFHRALCRLKTEGRSAPIRDDVRVVLAVPRGRERMDRQPDLKEWLAANTSSRTGEES